MEGKSCFFIGHREADERLLPRLELTIEKLITEETVRYFYVGGYGGFDRIAATAVKHAKQKYPDTTLMLVLPYHPAERPITTPNGFDGTYYPDGLENTPRRFLCEIGDRTYLCWTLSAEISCVIEYDADAVNKDGIFRMAESVPLSLE